MLKVVYEAVNAPRRNSTFEIDHALRHGTAEAPEFDLPAYIPETLARFHAKGLDAVAFGGALLHAYRAKVDRYAEIDPHGHDLDVGLLIEDLTPLVDPERLKGMDFYDRRQATINAVHERLKEVLDDASINSVSNYPHAASRLSGYITDSLSGRRHRIDVNIFEIRQNERYPGNERFNGDLLEHLAGHGDATITSIAMDHHGRRQAHAYFAEHAGALAYVTVDCSALRALDRMSYMRQTYPALKDGGDMMELPSVRKARALKLLEDRNSGQAFTVLDRTAE